MNSTAVQSATLAAIGYDSTRGILQLEFPPGYMKRCGQRLPKAGTSIWRFAAVFGIRWSWAKRPVGGVNADGANGGIVTRRQPDYGLHQFGCGGKDLPPG